MTKFRVRNYKNIEDTNWVNTNVLTCFVGKNESGKSAIFRGLSKLNPSDDEKYDGLKEFPRRRYTIDFDKKDWAVSSVEFELSQEEIKTLTEICPKLSELKSVICTRYYSWDLEVEFKLSQSCPIYPNISWAKYTSILENLQLTIQQLTVSEEKSAIFIPFKSTLLNILNERINQAKPHILDDDSVDASLLNQLYNSFVSNISVDWQKKILKKPLEVLNKFREDIQLFSQLNKAEEWVSSNIPKFIYFSDINVIDSAINITEFNNMVKSNPTDPRLRATKCLFEHVGLSLDDIQELDPTRTPNNSAEELRKMADKRDVLMSAASTTMTNMFTGWWEQRKHKFKYQVDGPSFRIWVSDNLDPSDIELDQRSQGMQYFFSFYLVFLVESKGLHSNSIILLDEPALHLHGTAQQKTVSFLAKLSGSNQLLYSTHSPFMIDGEHLENVRVVSEKSENGTVLVSENIWPNDEDSLFPLQAGLGYSIAQTLFYSKKQLIVEGLTDYWILKTINGLLKEKGMVSLKNDIVITPCGGIRKLFPLASMLIGNKIKIAILLDGDEPGKLQGKEAKEKLLTKCLFVSDYAKKEHAEIEDLLPQDLLLQAIIETYPDMKGALTNITLLDKDGGIMKRIKSLFDDAGVPFEKGQPIRKITDLIQQKTEILPETTLIAFEEINKAINKIFS